MPNICFRSTQCITVKNKCAPLGNTTIKHHRLNHGTVRKSHRTITITRHQGFPSPQRRMQKQKGHKAMYNTALEQARNLVMGATINNDRTTAKLECITALASWWRGLKCIILVQNHHPRILNTNMLSSHGGFLTKINTTL